MESSEEASVQFISPVKSKDRSLNKDLREVNTSNEKVERAPTPITLTTQNDAQFGEEDDFIPKNVQKVATANESNPHSMSPEKDFSMIKTVSNVDDDDLNPKGSYRSSNQPERRQKTK